MRIFRLTTWRILLVLAARNVALHRVKSLIVGFILMFVTVVWVSGSAFVDAVDHSMSETVTQSLTGHLQVYPKDLDRKFSIFRVQEPGANQIQDFAEASKAFEGIENVEALVPTGLIRARLLRANGVDVLSSRLQQALADGQLENVQNYAEELRHLAANLKKRLSEQQGSLDRTISQDRMEVLDKVLDDRFWAQLDTGPESVIRFLENEFAPLLPQQSPGPLRFLGTDPQLFARHFQRFEVVKGEMIPANRRGLLVDDRVYEDLFKHRVARQFDELYSKWNKHERSLAADEQLRAQLEQLKEQAPLILMGLSGAQRQKLRVLLQDYLDEDSPILDKLLRQFFVLTDHNVDDRYAFFYDTIGEQLPLYQHELGEEITIVSTDSQGQPSAVNVPLLGTYIFKGLEHAEFVGGRNLIDLVTYRRLHGAISEDGRREMQALRREMGVESTERDDVEDSLFGQDSELVVEVQNTAPETENLLPVDPEAADHQGQDATVRSPYALAPEDLKSGAVGNVAIFLNDPSALQQTRDRLHAVIDEQDLNLQVASGMEVSGLVGQYISVAKAILDVAVLVILLFALAIINNSMVMATLDRTREIGTMRALGGRRLHIMSLFILETFLLAALSGALGCGVAVVLIEWAGQVGIPAQGTVLSFLFSGKRLYPTVHWFHLLAGLGSVVFAGVASTLYPAWLAARVQPSVAMSEK